MLNKVFISTTLKCISWHIFHEIVENQDLYKNKDDFILYFLMSNIIYFNSLSVKCVSCIM